MKRLQIDKDIKPLSEFRAKASAFMQQIHNTKRPLILTQRGKSSVIVIDVAEYEKLMEKMEVLQDIQVAEAQLKEGKGILHEEAEKMVLAALHQ